MERNCRMETPTERIFPSNEGVGQSIPEAEVFPSELDLAAAVEQSDTGFQAPETGRPEVPGEIPSDVPEAEAVEPNKQGPPPGYEGVPSELWPDANGKPPQLTEKLMC